MTRAGSMGNDGTCIRDHQAWLGYLQPDGLVVSPAALVDCQVILPKLGRDEQEPFLAFVEQRPIDGGEPWPVIVDLPAFLRGYLGWLDEPICGLDADRPLPDRSPVRPAAGARRGAEAEP